MNGWSILMGGDDSYRASSLIYDEYETRAFIPGWQNLPLQSKFLGGDREGEEEKEEESGGDSSMDSGLDPEDRDILIKMGRIALCSSSELSETASFGEKTLGFVSPLE